MNKVRLREMQERFLGARVDLQKEFQKIEKIRDEFLKKFNREKIKELSLEQYVVGHGNRNTFCYWLETKLMDSGKIKGGSTSSKKFGIYFSKEKMKYIYLKKFGLTQTEAFDKIKKTIIELILAGEKKDISAIKNSPLSPMFKGKILSTYHPDKFLSIFSKNHLDHFIAELGIEDPQLKDEVDKREHLLSYKTFDPVMKEWSIYEFQKFLYEQIGKPIKKTGDLEENLKISSELKEYLDDDYEEIGKVKPNFIELFVQEIDNKTTIPSEKAYRKKIDFGEEHKKNRKLGSRGERVVYDAEVKLLTDRGRSDLAKKVRQVSREDDSLGYDILSFNEDGSEKHIEVKSTKSRPEGSIRFIISDNQLRESKLNKQFCLYVVFEANTRNPKIWFGGNPFTEEYKIKLTPIKYRVDMNVTMNPLD